MPRTHFACASFFIMVALGSVSVRAQSVDDAEARANRGVYNWTLKCFVLDSKASSDRERAGDDAKAAAYNAKARNAFDTAFKAGARIGLSDDQVTRDLHFAQTQELPTLVQDQEYFRKTAATCKALGLL